ASSRRLWRGPVCGLRRSGTGVRQHRQRNQRPDLMYRSSATWTLSERAGCSECHNVPIGMTERQLFGMQQQTVRSSKRFAFGIKVVAEDHMTERFHMHAQLVGTTCQGEKAQPGCALVTLQNLPACLRRLAAVVIDPMARFI